MATIIRPVSDDELEDDDQSMFMGNEFREDNGEDDLSGMKHYSDD